MNQPGIETFDLTFTLDATADNPTVIILPWFQQFPLDIGKDSQHNASDDDGDDGDWLKTVRFALPDNNVERDNQPS
ncbi:hypothetical protein EIP86_010360 [Pleurotus ostreatoroseus]|nr:hypothetical protein EIP86_010360 [Pleurotus ostreatoroseus]